MGVSSRAYFVQNLGIYSLIGVMWNFLIKFLLMFTDVMWGSVIPWHSYGRIEPFSFLTWMLDFSNSHCTRCQLVSVPVPQIFSQRGSFEGYFPEVQSSWNVNNFPRIFYSNGSIPLCLLHNLLFSQMKKEEGWHGDSHSVPAAHRVSVHSFAMQSASALEGCGRQPQGEIFSC